MAGDRWHAEYGVDVADQAEERQQRNLAALLAGYRPTAQQRRELPEAIHSAMTPHAADLERLAPGDPAFATLIERGYARAAREDAAWWWWRVCSVRSWRTVLEGPR